MSGLRLIALCTLIGSLGLTYIAVAESKKEPLIPGHEFTKVVAPDAKLLTELTSKGALDRRSARKVKAAAFIIAAAAHSSMDEKNSKKMSTLRDRAIALIKAVNDKNADQAKMLASQIAKMETGGGKSMVKWVKAVKFDTVMRGFSSPRIGGLGLERKLDDLNDVKKLEGEKQQEALALAYKAAAIAEVAKAFKPLEDEGMGWNPKNWMKFSDELYSSSVELAKAIKANKNISTAARKVTDSCVHCHDIFR